MKIKEYNQMMGYLTRPSKSTDPKQVKVDLEKTLNTYEDGADIEEETAAQKQLEKLSTQPNYGGKLWNAFVADTEAENKKKIEKPHYIHNMVTGELDNVNDPNWNKGPVTKKFEKKKKDIVEFINDKKRKPIQDIEHPNQVSFDPTTRLFSNKARTIAYQNYDDADDYNKKMGFKKQFRGDDRPIIKKKIIATPVKINFKPIATPPPPARRDPELVRIENNFNKAVRENEDEKRRNNSSGLAGLLGEFK